jgi:hypothetical protein
MDREMDELGSEERVAQLQARMRNELLEQAERLEHESAAALDEDSGLHQLATRQAELAAALRSLASRIGEELRSGALATHSMDSRDPAELVDQAEALEFEAAAAVAEAESMRSLATRQAALAARLRSLAARLDG